MLHFTNTYATIDIGSNAVRLFVARLHRGRAQVLEDCRAPIRLGRDTFSRGIVTSTSLRLLIDSLRLFRDMAEQHGAYGIRTIATSALREARNRDLVLQQVWHAVGLQIEIIDGLQEAELLYKAVAHSLDLSKTPALMIDMGGGSLEVVHTAKGKVVSAESLPLGTVRLLQRIGREQSYSRYAMVVRRELARWIESMPSFPDLIHEDTFIGTGGNLRCLGRLASQVSGRNSRSLVTVDDVEELVEIMFQMRDVKRAKYFNLKPDRVDVILPALVIVSEMMKALNFGLLKVPNVGIKNGLFWDMVEHNRKIQSLNARIQKEIR